MPVSKMNLILLLFFFTQFLAGSLLAMEEDPVLLAALKASKIRWQQDQEKKSKARSYEQAEHIACQLEILAQDLALQSSESCQLAKAFLEDLAGKLRAYTQPDTLESAHEKLASIAEFLHNQQEDILKQCALVISQLQADLAHITPKDQKNHNTITRVPKQLHNPNARCFMNAVVQCLYALPAFNAHILTSDKNRWSPMANSYSKVISTLDSATRLVDTQEFSSLGWLLLRAPEGQAHDAREFTQELLNNIASYCDMSDIIQISTNAGLVYNSQELTALDKFDQLKLLFPNIALIMEAYPALSYIQSLAEFSAQYNDIEKIAIHFPELAEEILHNSSLTLFLTTKQLQPKKSFVLTLPIVEANTLQDCLIKYFKKLAIGESHHVDYQATLTKTSRYLIIGLDRTMYSSLMGTLHKNEKAISFPVKNLNLARYSDRRLDHDKYDLVGCIIHIGKAAGGHYTAYVKHGNQWYYCNDASVTPITTRELEEIAKHGYGIDKNHTPVMFFYEAQ